MYDDHFFLVVFCFLKNNFKNLFIIIKFNLIFSKYVKMLNKHYISIFIFIIRIMLNYHQANKY